MKKAILFLSALSAALVPHVCTAAEGYLLLTKTGRQSLVHVSDRGMQQIATLGQVTVYGSNAEKIGVLSRDNNTRAGTFLLVDKATRHVDASWPVYVFPASQLLGPSEDLVVTDEYAYFVSVRFDTEGLPMGPNTLGGGFDFNRLALRDGVLDMVPLPREVTNPRLTEIDGEPIVYSSTTGLVWSFDPVEKSMHPATSKSQQLLGKAGRRDGMRDPSDPATARALPGTVSDTAARSRVFLDDKGVVQQASEDGKTVPLWDVATQVPGAVLQLTRVINVR